MPFDAKIWGPHGCFPLAVERASIQVFFLKGRIAQTGELPYKASALRVSSATDDGAKGAVLADGFVIHPIDGVVNLWVEPAPGTDAAPAAAAAPAAPASVPAVPAAGGAAGGGAGGAADSAEGSGGAYGAGAGVVITRSEVESIVTQIMAQHAPVSVELLSMLQKGLFTVLDSSGLPVCCGFFVTENGVAITVRHNHEDFVEGDGVVRAVMLKDLVARNIIPGAPFTDGRDFYLLPDEIPLVFRITSFELNEAQGLDYTCMYLTSDLPPGTFKPLPIPTNILPAEVLLSAPVALLHGSIASNREHEKNPSASVSACNIIALYEESICYNAATRGGESGSALILSGNKVIAMHVEGDSEVPADLEVLSPVAKSKAYKKVKLSHVSPTTRNTAMRLDLPRFQEAIQKADAAAVAYRAAKGGAAGGSPAAGQA